MTNPYELLGVKVDATDKDLKTAYRKAVKDAHPDSGGDVEKFRKVQEAFDVLIDPIRRERFDKLGRIDKSKVTPERVRTFMEQTIQNVINHQAPGGVTDDPIYENIKDKILRSLINARQSLQQMRHQTQRKIERATRMLERFKPNKDSIDYVGDALRAEISRLKEEINNHDDALEMSHEVERVFRSYGYEVGLDPEGQERSRPTRLSPITRTYF